MHVLVRFFMPLSQQIHTLPPSSTPVYAEGPYFITRQNRWRGAVRPTLTYCLWFDLELTIFLSDHDTLVDAIIALQKFASDDKLLAATLREWEESR